MADLKLPRAEDAKEFDFPKAELHCHLDGCFRLSTVIELAKERGISLPSYDPEKLKSLVCALSRKKNLAEYLQCFSTTSPPKAGSKESIARITKEAIEDKHSRGVRYIELRFSPHLLASRNVTPVIHSKKGDITPRDVVSAVCEASKEAQKKLNITVRLILCCILDFPAWSLEVAHFCKEFADQGVVAIDIAGSSMDDSHKVQEHVKAFKFCHDNGIHITVHAGEAGGAEEVAAAMNLLYAERIGHGYHTVDSDDVYAESRKRNIHFEVCPISSYLTAAVEEDLTKHPAIRFLKDGANFSLSTDNVGVQQTTLFDDYHVARTKFKFTVEDIKRLNLNALRSSFCEPAVKEKLLREFEAAYRLN